MMVVLLCFVSPLINSILRKSNKKSAVPSFSLYSTYTTKIRIEWK